MGLIDQRLINFASAIVAFASDYLIGAPLRPDWVDVPPVSMNATQLQQFQTAMWLSINVSGVATNPPQDFYPDFTYAFRDYNDQAMVTFMDGTCYGAFKGMAPALYDFMQGVGIYGTKDVCSSEGCCTLDRGISQGYYGQFWELFEEKIRECHHTLCPDSVDGCPVVLTGHSQGAAIATVASVALADLRPALYSFGGQKILHRGHPCHILDQMDTYLRVTTVCEYEGLATYDINAHVNPLLTHTGTMIILGHGGAATVAHNHDMTLMPYKVPCHGIFDPYLFSILQLQPDQPLDGFVPGSVCSRDVECKSNKCAHHRCTDLEI